MNRKVEIVETSKGKIEFSQEGQGIPILKIHGTSQNCDDQIGHQSLLAGRYSIITPCRPGCGNTPLSTGQTPEEGADLLNELLNYLHIESVYVLAFSGAT